MSYYVVIKTGKRFSYLAEPMPLHDPWFEENIDQAQAFGTEEKATQAGQLAKGYMERVAGRKIEVYTATTIKHSKLIDFLTFKEVDSIVTIVENMIKKQTEINMEEYPVHEKLALVKDKTQAIGDFLEWCGQRGLKLCSYGDESEKWYPTHQNKVDLLADFYEIDQKALEEEKVRMLDHIRESY